MFTVSNFFLESKKNGHSNGNKVEVENGHSNGDSKNGHKNGDSVEKTAEKRKAEEDVIEPIPVSTEKIAKLNEAVST